MARYSVLFDSSNWLKRNKKQGSGARIEVYLNEPGMVKDKSELLTDVYQLIR
jgi:effector-binding domain-containing protein